MTKPTAGGTKHNWLVEDLAAVVSDLRHTADGILRDLDNYQESREEVYLSSLATRIARLFQEISRITSVQSEMRQLIDAAKNGKGPEGLEGEIAELRSMIERIASAGTKWGLTMTASPATTIAVDTTLIAAFDAYALLDANLSMKAKGLAAILLASGSWAKEEDVTTDDLIALSTDGRDSILAGLRELESAGYLTRSRRTGEGGRIYWQRTMRARPKAAQPQAEEPSTALPYTENPLSLETVSSDIAQNGAQNGDRTIGGKAVHGQGGATSGKKARTIGGKAVHGAVALPIRAGTGTRTRADLGSKLLDLSNLSLEEDLDLDTQDQNFDLDQSSSSQPTLRETVVDARKGEGSGEREPLEPVSLETVSSDKPVPVADPVLAALAIKALTTAGVRVAAEYLYPRYAFEHIRAECVRHMSLYTTDYARGKNAGMLVHRIKNAPYKPLDDAERMDTHYLLWRTDAERAADRAAVTAPRSLEQATSVAVSSEPAPDSLPDKPRLGVERLIPGTNRRIVLPDATLPFAPEWERVALELAETEVDRWFDGAAGAPVTVPGASGKWLVYTPDATRLDWLNNRCGKLVARKLAPALAVPSTSLEVRFTADRAEYLKATGGS